MKEEIDFSLENLNNKLKANDTDFFYSVFDNRYSHKDEVKVVYDQHYGDGNDYEITLYFIKHDIYIMLEGTYSSWDSPYWDKVMQAEPFEFKETRYKKVTKEYLRNKTLGDVLNEDKEQ